MKFAILALATLLALPLAAPAPATCADPCSIEANATGYIAPAAIITSGTTVTFVNTGGGGHTTSDGTGSGLSAPFCFSANDDVGVRFDLVDGTLFAKVGTTTKPCANVRSLADGSVALPYYCRLHTSMRGALVVTP